LVIVVEHLGEVEPRGCWGDLKPHLPKWWQT
jgi:hypothetical protein